MSEQIVALKDQGTLRRKQTLRVDVLPSPHAVSHALSGIDNAELERLVQQRVTEIMADRDALVFEPYFRSRRVSYELKRLQTVSEQRKWTIYYDRYGCMICETRNRIHAGNGLCNTCHAKCFRRLSQIIAEGVEYKPARAARGASRAERRLPGGAGTNGLHHTYLQRSSRKELQIYAQIAKELTVSPHHVRVVAFGGRVSKKIARLLATSGLTLHPNVLATLEKQRDRERYARIAEHLGVSPYSVRAVAQGKKCSSRISAALERDCDLQKARALLSQPQYESLPSKRKVSHWGGFWKGR